LISKVPLGTRSTAGKQAPSCSSQPTVDGKERSGKPGKYKSPDITKVG
jgi:hypothetical protein